MPRRTISNTFTVTTVEDGLSQPSYIETQEAWSNYTSSPSQYTPPVDLVGDNKWYDHTPNKPETGNWYLWRRSRKRTLDEETRTYSSEPWVYTMLTGTNGTSIDIKGTVESTVYLLDGKVREYINGETKQETTTVYDGWSYICIADGHLYQWSDEVRSQSTTFVDYRSGWIDLGEFKGEPGVTYYTHVAWADEVETLKEKEEPTSNRTKGQISVPNVTGLDKVGNFSPVPDDGFDYMGICINTESEDDPGEEYKDCYTWKYVKGQDGTSPYVADLDNEMDSISCTNDGKPTAAQSVQTNVSFYYGSTPIAFTIEVFDGTESPANEYTSDTAKDGVTVTWNNSSGNIVFSFATSYVHPQKKVFLIKLTNSENSVVRYLEFKVNCVRGTALYKIVTSDNKIIKRKDDTYYPQSVTCSVIKSENGTETPMQSGYTMYRVLNGETTTNNTVNSSDVTTNVKFELYVSDVKQDEETIPLIIDGTDGEKGKPAPSYTEEKYGWSNDATTSSVNTSPQDLGVNDWQAQIPTKPSNKTYLWRRIIVYTLKTNWKTIPDGETLYNDAQPQYHRMNGENGTSIRARGSVVAVKPTFFALNNITAQVGAWALVVNEKKVYVKESIEWVVNTAITVSDGDCYTNLEDEEVYAWNDEATRWISIGRFEGTPGVSSYVHVAWATDVDFTTSPISVTDFSTTKVDESYVWMGVYVDSNAGQDERNASLYTWSYIKGQDGNSVLAKYSSTGGSDSGHDVFVDGDKYMKTSNDGGLTWTDWMRIVGESGGQTNFQFAISAVASVNSSLIEPTPNSGWNDAPIPTTDAQPYLWSKVQKKKWYDATNTWVDDGNPYYMRLNAAGSYLADLDNEMDSVPCDNNGKPMGDANVRTVTTNVRMWRSTKEITSQITGIEVYKDDAQHTSANNMVDKTIDGISVSVSNNNITFGFGTSNAHSEKIDFTIVATANDNETIVRSLHFTVNCIRGNAIYSLVPNYSEIIKQTDNTLIPESGTDITCAVTKTVNGNPVAVSQSEYTLTMSVDGGTAQSYASVKVQNITSQITYILTVNGVVVDRENVPVVAATKGAKGDDSVAYYIRGGVDSVVIQADQVAATLNGTYLFYYKEGKSSEAQFSTYFGVYTRSSSNYSRIDDYGAMKSTGVAISNLSVTESVDAIVIFLFGNTEYTQNDPESQAYLAKKEILVVKQGDTGPKGDNPSYIKIVGGSGKASDDTKKDMYIETYNGITNEKYSKVVSDATVDAITKARRGLAMAIIDRKTLKFSTVQFYDTWSSEERSDALASAMANVSTDYFIVIASHDATGNWTENLKNALASCGGSSSIRYSGKLNAPFAFIGYNGLGVNNGKQIQKKNTVPHQSASILAYIYLDGTNNGVITQATADGEDGQDGGTGERGKTGRFYYYAGEWNDFGNNDSWVVSDAQAPYFGYTPVGNTHGYYVFNPDENGTYTKKQIHDTYGDPNANHAPWVKMWDDFKYIITEAIFGQYAQFGSAIINGDWMLSSNGGVVDGVTYGSENPTIDAKTFKEGDVSIDTNVVPYLLFDGENPFGKNKETFKTTGAITMQTSSTSQNINSGLALKANTLYKMTVICLNPNSSNYVSIRLQNGSKIGDIVGFNFSTTSETKTQYFLVPEDLTYSIQMVRPNTANQNVTCSKFVIESCYYSPAYAVNMLNGETYQKRVFASGGIRSPFTFVNKNVIFSDTFNDNVALYTEQWNVGGGTEYKLPWDIEQSGRKICVTNYKWNESSSPTTGYAIINAPIEDNQYFYEDGVQKKAITLSREGVELLGFGDQNTFYGWIVLKRFDLVAQAKYGRSLKALAVGTYNKNGTFVYKTFDGSTLTKNKVSNGTFTISYPSGWFDGADDVTVIVSAAGTTDGSHLATAVLSQINNDGDSPNFVIKTGDRTSDAVDASFQFIIVNANDWMNTQYELYTPTT